MSSSNGRVADLAQFRSVFLIKPSSLGDIVHTLPSAHFIKRAYPHLELRWMCNPEWMPLLEGNPDLTEVVPFPVVNSRAWPLCRGSTNGLVLSMPHRAPCRKSPWISRG